MKFLDLNGLTYFFGKVKTWAGNNYLSLKGGTVNGDITITGGGLIMNAEDGISMHEIDTSPRNVSLSFIDGLVFSQALGDSNDFSEQAHYNSNEAKTGKFVKTNGTSTQVLIADGSVKGINSANGIAGLDARGYVPLAQLGNLDTTVAEVVTTLPTTNIKKHIYLVKDASNVTQNQYEEYIYTGDTSATYDASKWEKLGDFRATVDLANYYTKSQVDSIANGKSSTSHTHSVIINGVTKTIAASGDAAVNLGTYLTSHQSLAEYAKKSDAATSLEITPYANNIQFVLRAISGSEIDWPSLDPATSTKAGIMTAKDKAKLDGIANNANNYSLPTASSTTKGGITLGYSQSGKNYPVALDNNGKAYVNVPWTNTNTTYDLATPSTNGLMSAGDKTKLNGISSGATADSAITTAEIDALFT